MNTKTPIIRFFAEKIPQFVYDSESRPNLIFRNRLSNGLYQCIAIQRDSKSNGLAPNLAVTYSSVWRGETAPPLGIDRGFAQLRQKKLLVEAMDDWYFYHPPTEGLVSTLEIILADYYSLALPFFANAQVELLADKLLQTALQEAATIPVELRIGLPESLAAVRYEVAKCDHPAFLALKKRIQEAWTDEMPEEQRMWTNRLAYDALTLV